MIGGGEAEISPIEMSVAPSPEIAAVAAPVERIFATVAGEKPALVPVEIRAEHLAAPPAPLAFPLAATMSEAESSAHPMSSESVANAAAPRRHPGRGGNPAEQTLVVATRWKCLKAEDSRIPALQLEPSSAASAPKELEESAGHSMHQVTVQPQSEPEAEPEAVSAGA